jgi:hypothetical protein
MNVVRWLKRNPEYIHFTVKPVGADLCVRPHFVTKIHPDTNPNASPMNGG